MINYYITYDFPKDAILEYIDKMKDERYRNEDMRRKLVESVEITDHPFFIATQFHPEYKSRFLDPHPLFKAFVKACKK